MPPVAVWAAPEGGSPCAGLQPTRLGEPSSATACGGRQDQRPRSRRVRDEIAPSSLRPRPGRSSVVRPKVTRLAVDEGGWGKPRALRPRVGMLSIRKSLLGPESRSTIPVLGNSASGFSTPAHPGGRLACAWMSPAPSCGGSWPRPDVDGWPTGQGFVACAKSRARLAGWRGS